MNIVGFTGTRNGMTLAQIKKVIRLLNKINPQSIHHGACIGADEQFLRIVKKYYPCAMTIAHPSNLPNTQTEWSSDIHYPAKPPLNRNKDIVDNSMILIATPKTQKEELYSGTWTTIRYARKLHLPRYIIYPNGDISRDESK